MTDTRRTRDGHDDEVKKATIGQSDNRTIGQSDNRTTKIHNGLNSRDRVGVDRSIDRNTSSE